LGVYACWTTLCAAGYLCEHGNGPAIPAVARLPPQTPAVLFFTGLPAMEERLLLPPHLFTLLPAILERGLNATFT
jgi:hypothetical protein